MSLIETTTGPPRAFSDVIDTLGARRGAKLCLGEVVEAFGDRAFGAIMLMFAIVNMLPWPPGATTLTGLPLLFLSMELAWGRDSLWLPGWIERAAIDRRTFQRLSQRFMKAIRFSEHLSRPRLRFLTGGFGQGLVGLACLFLSLVLVLPIWGGNLVPAIAIGLFALGVMQRDGLAVIAGWIVTGISGGILFLAWGLIVDSFQVATAWIANLA